MASLATSSVETLRPENQFAASSFADVPFAAAARAGSPSIRLLSPGPETANAARPSSTPFGSGTHRWRGLDSKSRFRKRETKSFQGMARTIPALGVTNNR